MYLVDDINNEGSFIVVDAETKLGDLYSWFGLSNDDLACDALSRGALYGGVVQALAAVHAALTTGGRDEANEEFCGLAVRRMTHEAA